MSKKEKASEKSGCGKKGRKDVFPCVGNGIFEQLRFKIAVRQGLALVIMLVLVLASVVICSAVCLKSKIDDILREMSDSPGYENFWESSQDRKGFVSPDRNTLAVYRDGAGTKVSDYGFYSKEDRDKIIDEAEKRGAEKGNLKIGGKSVAYRSRVESGGGKYLYFYDYTEALRDLRNTFIMVIVSGVLGIIAITVSAFMFADRSVKPIKNAFVKQQELIANASHELKTPLTIINADISILNSGRENMSGEQTKWIDGISNQTKRMNNLVTEMLELTKMEAAKVRPAERINLSEAIEGAVLEAEALAFEHNITLETDIAPGVFMYAVETRMEKLVYILLENALKYTDVGGRVDVVLKSERKKIILKVRNTGEGLDKENIPKLFDRFYRADEAHTSENGFGLGLSIAKSITEFHGGTISADSEKGKYTEFTVTFK